MPIEDQLDMPVRELLKIIQEKHLRETTWCGIKALKNPFDFWVYQEIMWDTKPEVIIEIGTHRGGTTLALAHLCDCMGRGRVVSVDRSWEKLNDRVREHPRITLVKGEAQKIVDEVIRQGRIERGTSCMVIEDSYHSFENTLEVMRAYHSLVELGGYLIVEDGICRHGVEVGPSPGPYEAIEAFLQENDQFVCDRGREKYLITWNPKGFLKRIR